MYGDDIVDGLDFGTGILVGVRVGAVAAVRLEDGDDIDDGMEVFSIDGIEDEQTDGILVGSFGAGDGIGSFGCFVFSRWYRRFLLFCLS